jgi:hypothetical protein
MAFAVATRVRWVHGFKLAFTASALCVAVGCGDDDAQDQLGGVTPDAGQLTVAPSVDALAVASFGELPACNRARQGTLAYVQADKALYACLGGEWSAAGLDAQRGDTGATGETGETGAAGPVGEPGIYALAKLDALAAGSACATGGTRIDVGLDDDRDGSLDASEIDSTQTVCNGVAVAPSEDEPCTIVPRGDNYYFWDWYEIACPGSEPIIVQALTADEFCIYQCGFGARCIDNGDDAGTFYCEYPYQDDAGTPPPPPPGDDAGTL